jgi:DNA-binding NtrC family response regulator
MQESWKPVQVGLFTPDTELHRLLAAALRPEFNLVLELNASRLVQTAMSGMANVIVLDCDSNYSPLEDQLALCDQICESPVPVIVMADDGRTSTALDFLQRGAFDCIRKPPSLGELKVVVKRAHEHALMKVELHEIRERLNLTHGFGGLVGSSGRSQVVYDLIRRVADLSAYVLIAGESGTGRNSWPGQSMSKGTADHSPSLPYLVAQYPRV